MDPPSSFFSPQDNTCALCALLLHADARTRALLSALNSTLRARARLLAWQDFIKDFFVVDYNPAVAWEQQYVLLERWASERRSAMAPLPFAALHPRLRAPAFWFLASDHPATHGPCPQSTRVKMLRSIQHFLCTMNPARSDDFRFLAFVLSNLKRVGVRPFCHILETLLTAIVSRSAGPSLLLVHTVLNFLNLPPDRELRAHLLFIIARIFENAHQAPRPLTAEENQILHLLLAAAADPALSWRDAETMVDMVFVVHDPEAHDLLVASGLPRHFFRYERLSDSPR